MSWTPADDYDDQGNHCPGPYRRTLRAYNFSNCSPGCCRNGLRLCEEPRDPDDDLHEEAE